MVKALGGGGATLGGRRFRGIVGTCRWLYTLVSSRRTETDFYRSVKIPCLLVRSRDGVSQKLSHSQEAFLKAVYSGRSLVTLRAGGGGFLGRTFSGVSRLVTRYLGRLKG